MSHRTRLIFAATAVCCVVAFSLFLISNDTVRAAILDPLVKGINAARYLLGYMHQDLQWMISLLAVYVFVAILVACRVPKRERREADPRSLRFPSQGPAMQLAPIVGKSTRSRHCQEKVILELRDLAARSVAYREGITIQEAQVAIDTADWIDDPSVRDFLSLDKHRVGETKRSDFHAQVDHALALIEQVFQEE